MSLSTYLVVYIKYNLPSYHVLLLWPLSVRVFPFQCLKCSLPPFHHSNKLPISKFTIYLFAFDTFLTFKKLVWDKFIEISRIYVQISDGMVSQQGRFSEKGTRIVQLVTLPLFFHFFSLAQTKKSTLWNYWWPLEDEYGCQTGRAPTLVLMAWPA